MRRAQPCAAVFQLCGRHDLASIPPAHPFNPLSALRLIIAAGNDRRAVETVFNAVFLHGRDVAGTAVIADLAPKLDGRSRERARRPDDGAEAPRKHRVAIARGVFGVPTFVIDNEIFCGHDALDMVFDYLRDPRSFEDPEMKRTFYTAGMKCVLCARMDTGFVWLGVARTAAGHDARSLRQARLTSAASLGAFALTSANADGCRYLRTR
jgi:DSBA-like thioredoxin domain